MNQICEISAIETYAIRRKVLRKDIPLTEKIKGEFDQSSFHLGFLFEGNLIGVSSFIKCRHEYFSGSQFRLAGMAVLPKYQNKGVGKEIVEKAIERLSQSSTSTIWCNARVSAVNFYKKLGFVIEGDKFDIAYIGSHYIMHKNLKHV